MFTRRTIDSIVSSVISRVGCVSAFRRQRFLVLSL